MKNITLFMLGLFQRNRMNMVLLQLESQILLKHKYRYSYNAAIADRVRIDYFPVQRVH